MTTLSAVLTVRDEEAMLEGALRSLGFCDEIVVVVDDRTTDRTAEIARRHTEHVLVRPFGDFATSRNAGVERASGEWILHVDADERITPALAAEMRAAVTAAGPDVLGFRGPTIHFFWGRRMEHGGWGRMQQVRLIRRERATFSGRVHEDAALPPESIGQLDGERWHFSHRSIHELLTKTIRYGRLEAQDLYEAGAPKVTPLTFLKVMALEFGRRGVRRAGFRDGMPGIIEVIFQPFARFCAMVMLWELQRGEETDRRYAALERELESRR
jgi:glycosyltransferase involved in cell wall biosynthesis